MKKKITITIGDDGYTIDYPNWSYEQLMADLVAATILIAHHRLRRHELVRLVKRFWNQYKDVKIVTR